MSKYNQAGDTGYDSDAEADDEFERSVFTSPTLPAGYDDGDDHPSDSEDGHDTDLDGEEMTPTTDVHHSSHASPTGKITQWTEMQVGDWVSSLAPSLRGYRDAFIDEGVDGQALMALHHDELRELGVQSVGHRLTILKAVYERKIGSGVKIEDGDYVPLSAEGEKADMSATQDDIARVIESIRLRDQRIIAAETELKALKTDLDRIFEENRKLREETLPIMRLVKDQRTPLPDPAGGTIPSPRDFADQKENQSLAPAKESKGSSLSRKFSTKKLFLGSAPKQPSPTHPVQPTHQPSKSPAPPDVRDDAGTHLEASAAATAASNHLTASFSSQTSPTVSGQQLSPTSPAYSQNAPSSGGSYQAGPSSAAGRSFPRGVDGGSSSGRYDGIGRSYANHDDNSHWSQASQASTVVASEPSMRREDRARRQQPTPSPRETGEETPGSAQLPRERDRDRRRERDRDDDRYVHMASGLQS